MPHINQLVKQYLDYLAIERRRAPKTVEAYQRYLSRFLTWAQIESPQDITVDLAANFRNYLNEAQFSADQFGKQTANLQKSTQYYHLVALRSFLRYLAKQNINTLAVKDVGLGESPKRALSVLGDEEVERLLNSIKTKSLAGWRDQAILETLFATGLRVAELCSLSRLDFSPDSGQLSLVKPNGQVRVVFLSAPAKKAVIGYLEKRQDENSALFVNLGRGRKQTATSRLTPRSIQRIVKKYALLAGVDRKKVTPSALRHAFACGLLRAGADVASVQKLLGHAHLSTTQVYTKLASVD